jgi:hypothetical protein
MDHSTSMSTHLEHHPENYVTLPLAWQVMGQHADGRASQPHFSYSRWITENIDNLGKWRQLPMLYTWHIHGITPRGGADFYSLLVEVGEGL